MPHPGPETPAPSVPFRRKIILVKRSLQMKYVMLVFLFVLLTVSFVSLDIYYLIGKFYLKEIGEENLLKLLRGTSKMLALHLSVYSLVVLILSIFVSHKFAGPLFRLEKVSEAIAAGDLTVQAHLRKGDELFETADVINEMIERLRQKLMREKNLSDRIHEKLKEIADGLRAGRLDGREACARIEGVLVEVRHIASEFKL